MREKMSEWVLHPVDQRHIRRSQSTREAALQDACSQLLQGHAVNRIIGPNEAINAHKIQEWSPSMVPPSHNPERRLIRHPDCDPTMRCGSRRVLVLFEPPTIRQTVRGDDSG